MISSANIQNFMSHGNLRIKEFARVNLFIGKNDTGKSGLLKLLYASCKTVDLYSRRSKEQEIGLKKILAEKLYEIFPTGKKGLGELVSKITREKLSVDISFQHGRLDYDDRLHFSFGEATTNTIIDGQDDIKPISEEFRCVYMPPKEVLTALKAIRATRDNLHIQGFDDTYLDLIRALVVPTQRGNFTSELKEVNKRLEALFDGRIEQQDDDDFLFKKGNTEFSMQLTAEGIKKIGILTTLIRNRQLNSSSVLFLDEPETTLHPEAARELVKMLMLMAQAGVQIFLASHSYFILKQLHLAAREAASDVYCFELKRESGAAVTSEQFNLKDLLPASTLSEAAIEMADEEVRLDLGLPSSATR